jgi:hypothetical protein
MVLVAVLLEFVAFGVNALDKGRKEKLEDSVRLEFAAPDNWVVFPRGWPVVLRYTRTKIGCLLELHVLGKPSAGGQKEISLLSPSDSFTYRAVCEGNGSGQWVQLEQRSYRLPK